MSAAQSRPLRLSHAAAKPSWGWAATIAEIVAAQPHEGFAAAWLKRKGLDWAADMIATQTQEIAQ